MPKSKRSKSYSLTVPKKKGQELKAKLLQDIRNCIDTHAYVYVFSVRDMRNSKLKDVRTVWNGSRFFFGKNKVMAIALGLTPETEYKEGLHKVASLLKGGIGLFFTSEPTDKVLKWFKGYQEVDYARGGNKATHEVKLPAGPLPQFQHTMEPQLRVLGMPTAMEKGVVTLITEFEVCKQDAVLTPEQCQILKLLAIPMALFYIQFLCHWHKEDGEFTQLSSLELETVETGDDEDSDLDSQEVEPGSPPKSDSN